MPSEYHHDEPLLEAGQLEHQGEQSMVARDGTLVSQAAAPDAPPPAAGVRRIISVVPSFDSNGNVRMESVGRARPQSTPTSPLHIRLVDATPPSSVTSPGPGRRMAALPPLPLDLQVQAGQHEEKGSPATSMRSPTTPILTHAFRRSVSSPAPSDIMIAKSNSASTFRYPSLTSGKSKAKSPTPSQEQLTSSASGTPSSNSAHSLVTTSRPTNALPAALVPGVATNTAEGGPVNESWWRKVPMPPIPEVASSAGSVIRAQDSQSQLRSAGLARTPTAVLREPTTQPVAGPSVVYSAHHQQPSDASNSSGSGGHSGSGSGSGLSRSATQHTERSLAASLHTSDEQGDERRVSTMTNATFGGKKSSRPAVGPLVFGSRDDSGMYRSPGKSNKRKTISDYPPEPSPPLEPKPLSFPPPFRSSTPRESPSKRASHPLPQPELEGMQSLGDDNDPVYRRESTGLYANEEAASSSEQLLPEHSLELPDLRPVSPLDVSFSTPAASRSNTVSTRRSTSSKSKHKRRKEASASTSVSYTGSKRSFRSMVSSAARSAVSATRTSSSRASSVSRSKSRGRGASTQHDRHLNLTFGQETLSTPPLLSTSVPMPPQEHQPSPALPSATTPAPPEASTSHALSSFPQPSPPTSKTIYSGRPSLDTDTDIASSGEPLPSYSRPERPPSYTRGPRDPPISVRRASSATSAMISPTSISESHSMLTYPGTRRRNSRPLPVPPSAATEGHPPIPMDNASL